MPKGKHKKEQSTPSDMEIIQTFLDFKRSKKPSSRFSIVPETRKRTKMMMQEGKMQPVQVDEQTGNLILYISEFTNTEPDKFARISLVNNKKVVELNPLLGDQAVLARLFQRSGIRFFTFNLQEELTLERAVTWHMEQTRQQV